MGTHFSVEDVDLHEIPGGRFGADAESGEIGRAGYAVFYGALALSAALTAIAAAEFVRLLLKFLH
ncbi:MAG TPA: hypothetical protein VF449_07395 [Parvibaculum sp.]